MNTEYELFMVYTIKIVVAILLRYLDLPKRLELPSRPPKYHKTKE